MREPIIGLLVGVVLSFLGISVLDGLHDVVILIATIFIVIEIDKRLFR